MAEIREVNTQGEVVTPTPVSTLESKKSITAPVLPELQIKALEQVMGLETDSDRKQYADKVQTLLEYANAKEKGMDLEGLKRVIQDLELELGSPPLSERRISYVARYAYLKMGSLDHQKKSIALAQEAERLRANG